MVKEKRSYERHVGPRRIPKNLYAYQKRRDESIDKYRAMYPQNNWFSFVPQLLDRNGVSYKIPSDDPTNAKFAYARKNSRMFIKRDITTDDSNLSFGKKLLEVRLPQKYKIQFPSMIGKKVFCIHIKTGLECSFKISKILSGPKRKTALLEVDNFNVGTVLVDTGPYYAKYYR
jgi:hypothetical protein